ncbi:LacI family DNA-binding transcriptional regulator [Celerinatantimonas sp. YJH-8]|uniref:LacI family DNA-binding transcriptional regulator n=1 Tax=Celerinatantimonas sp. YJH-8 TaxID=3228714 RepID=UPI0038CC185E
MNAKRVVLSDVAKLAGVSKATVSRYLNHSLSLPEGTARRIEKAIKETHYQRNTLARRLSKGGSETIGLVIPDITNPFFAQLADAVEAATARHGYSLVLCISRNDAAKECQFIQWLDSRQVDGLLFITNKADINSQLKALVHQRRDIVLIDENIQDTELSKVFSDNFQGGYLATKNLIAAGHRHIAYIGGPKYLKSVKERFEGYRHALTEAQLPYHEFWTFYGDYERSFGMQATLEFMAQPQRPTAVFAASDYIAFGVLDGLKYLKLNAPESLSLAGYDDASFADLLTPRISTVRQPFELMGKTAVDILFAQMNAPEQNFQQIILPVEWIERDSITPLDDSK